VLSALKLSAVGAALALVASAALAGDAPAVFYPSLGYGQAPPAYDGPPPQASVGEPVYAGEPGPGPAPIRRAPPCRCVRQAPLPPPPPPMAYREREQGYAERGGPDERVYGEVRREEYNYDSGWRIRRIGPVSGCPYARMPEPHPVCGQVERERYVQDEHIPDVFFADAGGVGPDEFEGGGGGGGGVIEGGGGEAGAFAFASASARASAHIGIRLGRHPGGGGHGGGHMPKGCGCKK
jgi:hypothetical protein